MNLPHISTGIDENGRMWVQVEDTELFDCVEDLLEEHDIDYLWVLPQKDPVRYTMTFEDGSESKVRAALSLLDPEEVHRIYLINNSEGSS